MDSGTRLRASFDSIAVIVAFDYYDGPEAGLAVLESGEAIRFSSLGDSDSRLQRAFEMAVISGDWWPEIEAVMRAEGIAEPRRLILPHASSTSLTELIEKVRLAVASKLFVAVGGLGLEALSVAEASDREISGLRELDGSPAAFPLARRIARRGADEV